MVLHGRDVRVVKMAEACSAVKPNLTMADFESWVGEAVCPVDVEKDAGERNQSKTLKTELATPQARNYQPVM